MHTLVSASIIFLFSTIVLLAISFKTYLSIFSLLTIVLVSYFWLVQHLAPAPSPSRLRSKLGLCQVYPLPESSALYQPSLSGRKTS